MNVEVFIGQTPGTLSITVGEWLSMHPNAKIRCAAQSQSDRDGLTLTIFYDNQ